MSAYESDKNLHNFGMTMFAAVLLLSVAITGYLLMVGDGMTYQVFAMTLVSLLALTCFVAALARGSRSQSANSIVETRSIVIPPPAPVRPTLVVVPPVREAIYVDGLRDIRLPLGEAFDVLVDF